LLRATASTGYRAPSTSELFQGSSTFQFPGGAVEFFDPCAPGNQPEGEVAARCIADGVPLGSFDPQVGPVVRNGSNPDLQPEQARGRAIGVVWSPRAVAGLDVTLDWWWIRLENAIDVIFEDELPRMCYRRGIEGACRRLTRDPATGVLTSIDARLHNYGTFEVEGYDLGVGYRWENAAGRFAFRGDGTYLSRYTKQMPDGAEAFSTVGNYFPADPNWRLRLLLALDWDRGPVGITARLRYYSALDESCEKPANVGQPELCDHPDLASPVFGGVPEHQVDARTYLDLQVRWQPREGTTLSLGAGNILGEDPPVAYSSINSYDPSYDVPGRFWYLSAAFSFH
jgi:iron complex outermembrane receptor protein